MADPISEPTIVPISPAVAEAMSEGVHKDEEAPRQASKIVPVRRQAEMRRPLRQSLGNPTLNRKTVSRHSRSEIFGLATRMGTGFL